MEVANSEERSIDPPRSGPNGTSGIITSTLVWVSSATPPKFMAQRVDPDSGHWIFRTETDLGAPRGRPGNQVMVQ